MRFPSKLSNCLKLSNNCIFYVKKLSSVYYANTLDSLQFFRRFFSVSFLRKALESTALILSQSTPDALDITLYKPYTRSLFSIVYNQSYSQYKVNYAGT